MVGVGGGDFVGGRERGGAASGGVWVGAVCWGELFSFGSIADVGSSGAWGVVCVRGFSGWGLVGGAFAACVRGAWLVGVLGVRRRVVRVGCVWCWSCIGVL